MSKNFIVTVDDTNERAVEEALSAQGINCVQARASTQAHEGYAFTELAIAGIWEHETGYAQCEKPGGNGCGHRAWKDLSDEQRTTFAARLATFLDRCRYEDLEPEILLQDATSMEGIRLSVDEDDGGNGRSSPLFYLTTMSCHSESHDSRDTIRPVHQCRNCNQTFCNSCTDMEAWNGANCPLCNASLTGQAALATWDNDGKVLRLTAPDGSVLGRVEEVPRFSPPMFTWRMENDRSRNGQELGSHAAEDELIKTLVANQ